MSLASSGDWLATLAARLACGSDTDQADAYATAAELVVNALGGGAALVYSLDDTGWVLTLTSQHGAPSELLERIGSVPIDSANLAAVVARTRRVQDADGAAEDAPPDARAGLELGCGRWAIAIPFVSDHRLTGVLVCFSVWPDGGKERLQSLLLALAAVLAKTLTRARPTEANTSTARSNVFRGAQDAIFIADDEGRIIDVNPYACELFRASKDELLHWTVFDLALPDMRPTLEERWPHFLVEGASRGRGPFRRADSSFFMGEFAAQAHFVPRRHMSIVRDISAQAELEQRLRLSETRSSRVERAGHIGTWDWTIETNAIYWSDELFRLFGRVPTAETLTYADILSLVHPDDRAAIIHVTDGALRGVAPFSVDYRIIRPDGQERTLHAECDISRDENGRVTHVFGVVQDVTERRAAERALQKSELLFRQVLETLPVGVWVSDEHGQLILVNSAGKRIWGGVALVGIDRYDEYKAWWADAGKRIQIDEWAMTRAIRNGETVLNDCLEIKTFDGERKFILNSAAPVLDPEGRILGAVAINEDVTARLKLERERERLVEALSTEQRWLQTIFERSPVGIVFCRQTKDEKPKLIANHRAEELLRLDFSAPDALDVLRQRMRHPDGSALPENELSLERTLRGETVIGRELLIHRPPEGDLSILVNASPICSDSGQFVGAMLTYEDVTSLKQLERLRQEWTSIVAHDLRQPVATIATVASLLQRASNDPKVVTRAERIIQSVKRLDRMIGDLTDVSQMEAHRIDLLPVPTDIAALLRRVTEASEHHERTTLLIRGDIPRLSVDPQRMEQIIENLLSNAIKYGTPGTPIEITLERGESEILISVRNEGIGIASDELPTLFERFQRGHAHGGPIKGLGLGLYIVRGLVEAHGGHIDVYSTPGESTTFRFTLPILPTDGEPTTSSSG